MYFLSERQTKTALFITLLLICGIAIGLVAYSLQQFKRDIHLANLSQTTRLSHLLVSQHSAQFGALLSSNASAEKLTDQLDRLTQERFVLDASLYLHNGELLAQSQSVKSYSTLRSQNQYDETLQVIEQIHSRNGIDGFLRVTFISPYNVATQDKIDRLFQQLYGRFLAIFLLGILLASSVHYFIAYFRKQGKHKAILSINTAANRKKNVLNFHQRKRRFMVR